METIITVLIIAIVLLAILYILSIWVYKRAPTNMGFVRTGFMGTKVCFGSGAIVLPVFHEVTWVSLETIKLIVRRARDDAILTSDKIRIDVTTELYAHVGHNADDVLTASRSLGEKTFDPDKVRNLLEAKVVSALRTYAATKTLSELHENRDAFAQNVKENVLKSFQANGLTLEEVTIVTLEQTSKEHFKTDNVFDAEGLKIITEITSDARRKVHETEKRTTVSIRQKDLDTQLELLEIEKQEAFARAGQDKDVANEQALRVGEKLMYILDQRMAVEQKEIDNEKALEQLRTARDVTLIEEAKKREISEIQKALILEQKKRDREIALIAKAQEEELANIQRNLALERAEKDRQIELIKKHQQEELTEIQRALALEQAEKDKAIELESKEQQRQQAEIGRVTAVLAQEEVARNQRHQAAEEATVAIRQRDLDTKLTTLDLEKQEAFANARNEQQISDEQARVLSEKQRFILDQRWQVEQEELSKAQALETAQIQKDIALLDEARKREAAEIGRLLAREQEERNRDIALTAKDEELSQARIRHALAIELEERNRDIALIAKEQERERADIQRFLAREQEERDREIALAAKTSALEEAEAQRLAATATRAKAESNVNAVRLIAEAERQQEVDRIEAEAYANAHRIREENQAQVERMHLLTQAEARETAAGREAEATLTRARADSEAQQIGAVGQEKQAAAQGRADMAVEELRVANTQRMLEAEAAGIEAKADALKKYNDQATYLELARLHIEAERDIHIDQAKAMGNALQNAQIRMYGGEGGTVDTIRGLFTTGFGLGEALEGVAQSLPEGLRERFAENGLRGIFGKPGGAGQLKQAVESLSPLVERANLAASDTPFGDALTTLRDQAGDEAGAQQALALLDSLNKDRMFDTIGFGKVWTLLQAAAKSMN